MQVVCAQVLMSLPSSLELLSVKAPGSENALPVATTLTSGVRPTFNNPEYA